MKDNREHGNQESTKPLLQSPSEPEELKAPGTPGTEGEMHLK